MQIRFSPGEKSLNQIKLCPGTSSGKIQIASENIIVGEATEHQSIEDSHWPS